MIGFFVGMIYGLFQSIYNIKKIDENFKKKRLELEYEYKMRNGKD